MVCEGQKWYVVQSKPQKEAVVCAQLSRFNSQMECFLPKIRNHLGVRPLFPSYVFIRTGMKDVVNYRSIKYTRGLLRIIGTKEEGPIAVASEIIAAIKKRMGPNDLIDQTKVFVVGKGVRVRRGPLKDLMGILEKVVSDEGRIQVLFRLLKYPFRAVLKFEDLDLV